LTKSKGQKAEETSHSRAFPAKSNQTKWDVGDLASALALEMFSVERAADRAPRFVAAMVALGAGETDIAEVLQIGLPALKAEISRELNRSGITDVARRVSGRRLRPASGEREPTKMIPSRAPGYSELAARL
jgi:hypothetical protein